MSPERPPDLDLYAVLQITPDAEVTVILAAHRALVRAHHPDVSTSADALERTKLLNLARDWLIDPTRRAAYDAERTARMATPSDLSRRSVRRSPPAPSATRPHPREKDRSGAKDHTGSRASARSTSSDGGDYFDEFADEIRSSERLARMVWPKSLDRDPKIMSEREVRQAYDLDRQSQIARRKGYEAAGHAVREHPEARWRLGGLPEPRDPTLRLWATAAEQLDMDQISRLLSAWEPVQLKLGRSSSTPGMLTSILTALGVTRTEQETFDLATASAVLPEEVHEDAVYAWRLPSTTLGHRLGMSNAQSVLLGSVLRHVAFAICLMSRYPVWSGRILAVWRSAIGPVPGVD